MAKLSGKRQTHEADVVRDFGDTIKMSFIAASPKAAIECCRQCRGLRGAVRIGRASTEGSAR
jgi:hypothetical protein